METKTPLAWHGDPALKAEVMERLRRHRADDAIVQQIYQQIAPEKALGYRGCALGCTLPQQPIAYDADLDDEPFVETPQFGWTGEIQRVYGIRASVAAAIEDVFEMLPPAECADFVLTVIDAIPVGADLEGLREWACDVDCTDANAARATAAELIERLRTAPVPTPA